MNYFKKFLRENPVKVYYIVTFLISWGGLVIMLGGPDRISSAPNDTPFLPLYFITVAGPCVAGILLTGLYDGIQGYRQLLSRLVKWRAPTKIYAAALLIAPLTVFTSLLLLSIFSPAYIPGLFSSSGNHIASAFGLHRGNTMFLLLFVIGLGIFNGFVEELGWTGFVAPRIKSNHSLMKAGFIAGIMWGLWHFLSNYLGSAKEAGNFPLSLYIIVLLFSFLPPFRILMMWVYRKTESLFIAILMHACLDVFWILSMPAVLTGQQRATWYMVWAALLWGLAIIVTKTSSHKQTQRVKTFSKSS